MGINNTLKCYQRDGAELYTAQFWDQSSCLTQISMVDTKMTDEPLKKMYDVCI